MRRCRWLVVAWVVAVLFPTLPASHVDAAILTVTNTQDSGSGSLRQTISDAGQGDTIIFAPGVTGTIALASTLTLTKDVTIQGPGADTLAIDGGCAGCEAGQSNPTGGVRVLAVNIGITATVRGLTLRHGLTMPASESFSGWGGGILNRSTLTVADSTISGNSADIGGGIANLGTLTLSNTTIRVNNAAMVGPNGWGGGIYNTGLLFVANSRFYGNAAHIGGAICQFLNGSGAASVASSVLSGNYTNGDGGAIYSDRLISIDRTTIIGNFITTAGGSGGGIRTTGSLSLTNSTLAANRAATGGGLATAADAVTLANATFTGNIATVAGGGIANTYYLTVATSTFSGNRAPTGGGIYNAGATLSLTNSTLAENIADTRGGGLINTANGLAVVPGTAMVTDSTLSGNTAPDGGGLVTGYASTTTLARTIIAAPVGGMTGTCATDSSGVIVDNGYNLQYGDPTPTCGTHATDVMGRAPLLGPFAGHGGPTDTLALLPGSPAIDAGGPMCPATDQRGMPRPRGSACDIGAYEFAGVGAAPTLRTPPVPPNGVPGQAPAGRPEGTGGGSGPTPAAIPPSRP